MVKIIDASIGIKWFIEEPGHEEALEILSALLEAPEGFIVPELFFFEMWNILSILFRKSEQIYADRLNIISDTGITRDAFTIELENAGKDFIDLGLTAYDASYAGLARLTSGVWITADKKAHKKIEHLNLSKLLENYQQP